MTQTELNKTLATGEVITNEVINILKELDTTPSTATQASLNGMLLDLRKRISKGDNIRLESNNTILTVETFDEFVQDTFEVYSVKLYMNSI